MVGSLKNHKNRSVVLPAFVVDELAHASRASAATS